MRSTAIRFSVPDSSSESFANCASALRFGYCSAIARSRPSAPLSCVAASICSPRVPPAIRRARASAIFSKISRSWPA
jgi:hypothetical protein